MDNLIMPWHFSRHATWQFWLHKIELPLGNFGFHGNMEDYAKSQWEVKNGEVSVTMPYTLIPRDVDVDVSVKSYLDSRTGEIIGTLFGNGVKDCKIDFGMSLYGSDTMAKVNVHYVFDWIEDED